MLYAAPQVGFLAVALGAASFYDATRRRIPNWLTVPILASGLVAQAMAGGVPRMGLALLASAGLFAVLLPIWARGYVGGGDLKVGVAAAAWVGAGRLPQYLLATAAAGGLLAVFCYLRAGAEARRAIRANALQLHVPAWSAAMRIQGKGAMVPYGAAFAAGALFAVLR